MIDKIDHVVWVELELQNCMGWNLLDSALVVGGMSVWANGWVDEWMDEYWVNEWMNEWMMNFVNFEKCDIWRKKIIIYF